MTQTWRTIALGALLLGCSDRNPASPTAHPSGAGFHAGGVGGGGDTSEEGGAGRNVIGGAAGQPTGGGGFTQAGTNGAGSGGETGNACADAARLNLEVFSPGGWDPLGYPPYAVDGCHLVYIRKDQGDGVLYLRDLSTGDDLQLDAGDSQPRRPAIAGDVIAWEANLGGKSQVRVRFAGVTSTLSGEFDHGGEPRVTNDAVVFTAFLGPEPTDDTDVYLYDVTRAALSPVASGPGQQRFADVSPSHVAITDFSEDPDGYFDERDAISDVVLIDRETGQSVPRNVSGKQAFPLLGSDGALVYLEWGAVHPEPKFSQFWLKSGRIGESPSRDVSLTVEQIHTDPAYVRPSLRGHRVDFVDVREQVAGLYRADVGSLEPPVAAQLSGATQLFGPVATDTATLISKPESTGALSLFSVAR